MLLLFAPVQGMGGWWLCSEWRWHTDKPNCSPCAFGPHGCWLFCPHHSTAAIAVVLVWKWSSPAHGAAWSGRGTVGWAGRFPQRLGGRCCLVKHLNPNELGVLTAPYITASCSACTTQKSPPKAVSPQQCWFLVVW